MAQFKAIKPKPLNLRAMQAVTSEAMEKVTDELQLDYQVSVKDFNRKVEFSKQVKKIPRGIQGFVWYEDKIFSYVDEGTDGPYTIVPKNSRVLAFQPNYQRKSIPNMAQSQPGGASGETVFAQVVVHPGTKAANITKVLARRWQTKLPLRMRAAMAKVVQVSGHRI
jgi:hypothetical protein